MAVRPLLVLFILIAIAGVVGAVVIALSAGDPAGSGLSILFALIPLPLLWFVYWWLDRYEPEPRRYKFAAFVWGGVVAVAIALVLEIWIQETWDLSDEQMASFVAPLTEEPAKCLFLLLTFLRARRVIDGFLDGLIFAGIVGIGFAFVENIGYYAAATSARPTSRSPAPRASTTTFIVRGLFSPFAHPLFTSAFGIAIGLAAARRSKTAQGPHLLRAGCWSASGLHALWNGSLSFGGGAGFLLAYLALAAVLVGRRGPRDHRPQPPGPDPRAVAVVRRAARLDPPGRDPLPVALQLSQGRPAVCEGATAARSRRKVVTRYQRLATEMAFLHDGLMSGRTIPRGVERTYALLDAMYELRPMLRFPPALQSTVSSLLTPAAARGVAAKCPHVH